MNFADDGMMNFRQSGELHLVAPGIHIDAADAVRAKAALKVYLMDLWSFIPYYMSALCTALRVAGVEATLASVRYHLDRDYFRKSGIRIDSGLLDLAGGIRITPVRRALKLGEYLMNLLAFAIRFKHSRPDILHIQFMPLLRKDLPFDLWFIRYVKRLGIPIVYTVHNIVLQDSSETEHKPPSKSLQLVYRTADALICHGEAAKARLVRQYAIAPEKVWVIPHGPLFWEYDHGGQAEARASLHIPHSQKVVLFLGVISPYKGVDFLLKSWKTVHGSVPQARLMIAGTGEERLLSQIRRDVRNLGISTSVDLRLRFIPVDELPLFYKAADILVYPYKSGTTSGALMTGLGYRKPIVATSIPLFNESLRPGQNADLVPYGNVDALATSLVSLLVDPQKRNRLSQGSDGYSDLATNWDIIAGRTAHCYDAVVNLASQPAR